MIRREQITGLVLAGGQGNRMGGLDKGLQPHRGVPLALHALYRLTPQVGQVLVSANRHLDAYRAFGVPVCRDDAPIASASGDRLAVAASAPNAAPAYAGPLAGFLAGLHHCPTPYLATVPCDAPDFPADLVERLAAALSDGGGEIAMAATRGAGPSGTGVDGLLRQPVFCLLSIGVAASLLRCLQGGERKVARWAARHRCVDVPFDDAAAFANANTLDELARLQPGLESG